MSVFDLENSTVNAARACNGGKTKDECIIALKVYDSCRQQDCLESDILGPARAACNTSYCGESIEAGEIIVPPSNAAGVTVSDLSLKNVVIVSKTPNQFRNGYWDIDLKYVFNYTIIFRDVSANELCSIAARSVFNKKVTLFGSITTNSLISTDLFSADGNSTDLSADPFILVESKAIALAAELRYGCCCNDNDGAATEVDVTIGLFTIVKLFRLVNLLVESKGFCIPEECEDVSALSPCEFFNSLDFPMDVFAPPQKAEFFAGVSSNIPASTDSTASNGNSGCGCNR
jgi:hypothetical protein